MSWVHHPWCQQRILKKHCHMHNHLPMSIVKTESPCEMHMTLLYNNHFWSTEFHYFSQTLEEWTKLGPSKPSECWKPTKLDSQKEKINVNNTGTQSPFRRSNWITQHPVKLEYKTCQKHFHDYLLPFCKLWQNTTQGVSGASLQENTFHMK